jgi:hypothetical protein
VIVRIPTINDDLADFYLLFDMWAQFNHEDSEVELDFSRCGFLRQNAVAFLGGLIRLKESRGGNVTINPATINGTVAQNLAKSGFGAVFGLRNVLNPGHSIPFREDKIADSIGISNYLKEGWLGRGWLHITEPLKNAIVGTVWEVYANAIEHGASNIGIFSCGQHYPRMKSLKLTIVDFGVGVPANVRRFFGDQALPAERTLEWAFRAGTTTKPSGIGRGLGLDILKQFIRVNKGQLEVFSHNAYAFISSTKESYVSHKAFFEGTLVNISLECDENHYCLASELPQGPLF